MAEPFIAEIRLMSFNFAPQGWAQCNGQLMQINQNQALFALLGTTYGGNGQTNFGLPNLQGRAPIHFGGGHVLGEQGGEQAHTLSTSEIPSHKHGLNGVLDRSNTNAPGGAYLAGKANTYGAAANSTTMAAGEIANVGGSQPHQNMQPYLVMNFCIALQGIFPSPN